MYSSTVTDSPYIHPRAYHNARFSIGPFEQEPKFMNADQLQVSMTFFKSQHSELTVHMYCVNLIS